MEPKQQPPYPLRMPPEMRYLLEEAARQGNRSLHSELLARLASSLSPEIAGKDAARTKAELIRVRHYLERALNTLERAEHRVFIESEKIDRAAADRPARTRIEAFEAERDAIARAIDRVGVEVEAIEKATENDRLGPNTQTLLNLRDRLEVQRRDWWRRLEQIERVLASEREMLTRGAAMHSDAMQPEAGAIDFLTESSPESVVLVGNIGRTDPEAQAADIAPPGEDVGSKHRPAAKRRKK